MNQVTIQADFWSERLEVNARQAIFHQWEQLEASGCIENFRILAGDVEGFREGWFFADSDAYKWLDAAARIWRSHPDAKLAALMDAFILLLGRAQAPDGYLFTYNQIHFPGVRWQNLQIEHELYCHGHLIEAGVSHYQATGRTDLLGIARRAADRIVADFQDKGPEYTPGHEAIEMALIRLHQVTPGDMAYLDLARQFIEQRGRAQGFVLSMLRQGISVGRRVRYVQQQKQIYLAAHPTLRAFQLPPENQAKKPATVLLRALTSALSGKYFQQHAPVREQRVPVGHSVRFAYLETAIAMLARESGDRTLLPALEQAWERMVTRRMYLTGGIGALPVLEGFGQDDELDPEYAYTETCAALGSMFWNWEMTQLTGEAKYSDLFEWQLYNAAAVGMGLDGKSYLYNNPLACHGGITRRSWYSVPCCPSNLSRTWADLGRYLFTTGPGVLWLHQYLSSQQSGAAIALKEGGTAQISFEEESGLPWNGSVRITITHVTTPGADRSAAFEIRLRQPSWATSISVRVNGNLVAGTENQNGDRLTAPTADASAVESASGYDPRQAVFRPVSHPWSTGDVIELDFETTIQLRCAPSRVKAYRGKVAVTRGPLVYCLESVDNPSVDLFTARLDTASLVPVVDTALLGGIVKLQGKTKEGTPLTFIPYFLWGNRGSSQMTVWVNA